MSSDFDDLLSLAQAAALVERSPVTLRWAAQRGLLAARLIGTSWVTSREAVLWYEARFARHRDGLRMPRPRRRRAKGRGEA